MVKLVAGVGSAVALFILASIFWPLVSVPAGHVGVVTMFGEVRPDPITPGMSLINPFAHVTNMSIQQMKLDAGGEAGTKDLQTVAANVTVNYHANPASAVKLYQEIGMDYAQKLIAPVVPDRMKSVTSRFNAEELITKRDDVRRLIRQAVIDGVMERSGGKVIIDDVVVTNFGFAASFNKAVAEKQVAEQMALKAKNDLDRIKVEAEQTVVTARAEAEAFKLKSLQITPLMVEMERIHKWDGALPTYVGGGISPFLALK